MVLALKGNLREDVKLFRVKIGSDERERWQYRSLQTVTVIGRIRHVHAANAKTWTGCGGPSGGLGWPYQHGRVSIDRVKLIGKRPNANPILHLVFTAGRKSFCPWPCDLGYRKPIALGVGYDQLSDSDDDSRVREDGSGAEFCRRHMAMNLLNKAKAIKNPCASCVKRQAGTIVSCFKYSPVMFMRFPCAGARKLCREHSELTGLCTI